MKKELEIKMENTEDFEKFARGITRKEFKEDYLKGKNNYTEKQVALFIDDYCIECPEDIELENGDGDCIDCKECWMHSVEDIYFKDDIDKCSLVKESITYDKENKIDYTKEYTLQEVFEFPKDTIFDCRGYEICIRGGFLNYCSDIENDIWLGVLISEEWLASKYKLSKQEREVTFIEVLNSKGNCKCKVNYYSNIGKYESEYCGLGYIFQDIADNYDDKFIKNIIKNGTWFIKEEIR